jgi:hypothetical protein
MLSGLNSFLSPASWDGDTVAGKGQQIHWTIEVDAREREVVLSADCECGCPLSPQYFDHPDSAFEAAEELTCPDHEEPEEES